MRALLIAALVGALAGCAARPEPAGFAVANNAVARVDATIFTFAGLKSGKTHADVTADAYAVNLSSGERRRLPSLPDGKGRLASVAAEVEGRIYIFGGYTVAPDGAEVSTPDVFAFDPLAEAYSRVAPMPTPVDDSVALVAGSRVYLISGWSNDGNVKAVQILDTQTGTWSRAGDYPGTPVFGHAGGIVGRTIVIFGGVTAEKQSNGRNRYAATDEAWLGEIDAADAGRIAWRRLDAPPVKTRYRVAASGSARLNAVVFAGGTDNPYNYNGIGYDKNPSAPSAEVFSFNIATKAWRMHPRKPQPTMDHRGLVEWAGRFHTLGGMMEDQRVTGEVSSFVVP